MSLFLVYFLTFVRMNDSDNLMMNVVSFQNIMKILLHLSQLVRDVCFHVLIVLLLLREVN